MYYVVGLPDPSAQFSSIREYQGNISRIVAKWKISFVILIAVRGLATIPQFVKFTRNGHAIALTCTCIGKLLTYLLNLSK